MLVDTQSNLIQFEDTKFQKNEDSNIIASWVIPSLNMQGFYTYYTSTEENVTVFSISPVVNVISPLSSTTAILHYGGVSSTLTHTATIMVSPTSTLINQTLLTNIAYIIKDTLKQKEKPKYIIVRNLEDKIFEYFRNVAEYFKKPLKDKTELPKIIDVLMKEGHINEDSWKKLLDFLLRLDGLSLQDEIANKDIKLLNEYASDLEKAGALKIQIESNPPG